ncbi:flagellar hook-length control protein FliK [Paenibacillus sp. MWE-103]|uniref:Flagellar hook-length control protein FliK n=1 Tax=Paenibacillus artemisiicola TaxID=1172618 RepID=A0ABS3WHW4_9BACL|nr:flagellar hook-length control protein FliK [Paenibacillus artemisiicola]MBO7747893.1 flagellar hook-length control protein FliK [Paenibacillus artemisiicola]
MQMPITAASPAPAPAAGHVPSAKGADGAKFNQAFAQTMTGAPGKGTNAQPGGETASGVANAPGTPASPLGEHGSAADLLKAIEALLRQLGEIEGGKTDEPKTDDEPPGAPSNAELGDALQQLDNLLSLLAGIPMPQQPAAKTPADAAPDSDALKAGLQEALTDLGELLRQPNGAPTNRDQLALIGKELTELEALLGGKSPKADATAASRSADNGATVAEPADLVRALTTTSRNAAPQASVHLQRMAHRMLHASVLDASRKPEDDIAADALADAVPEAPDSATLPAGTAFELPRMTAALPKTVVSQQVPVQQFAATIQGLVVKQFNVTAGENGSSQAQLTLFPEHLGQVNVNISVHNGTLTAQFVTDTATAKDMLETQLAQLRSALQSQGLQVDKLVVSQSAVQGGNPFQQRQGHQGQEHEASKRNKSRGETIDEIDFSSDLEAVTTQQAVDRDLGLGRGIHTIA